MISVAKLTRKFGAHVAVSELDFEVKKGDIVGFLGPNGAGKSTTMKMLTGFLPMTSGDITIAEMDIRTKPIEIKKRIGYLPEGAPSYHDMSVFQFLNFIAEARGIKRRDRKDAIANVVYQVELKDVLNKTIDNLSKGFKRRVGIAQALIHDPDILILDEPTDGLDPNQKHQVRQLIASLGETKTVIVSTHILEEVSAVCNRAIIIAKGEKRFDGTPDELFKRSRYFNAVTIKLSFAADVSGLKELEGVKDLEFDPFSRKATVFSEGQLDILYHIQKYIDFHKLPVEYMYPEAGRLDDVFREITGDREVA